MKNTDESKEKRTNRNRNILRKREKYLESTDTQTKKERGIWKKHFEFHTVR